MKFGATHRWKHIFGDVVVFCEWDNLMELQQIHCISTCLKKCTTTLCGNFNTMILFLNLANLQACHFAKVGLSCGRHSFLHSPPPFLESMATVTKTTLMTMTVMMTHWTKQCKQDWLTTNKSLCRKKNHVEALPKCQVRCHHPKGHQGPNT